MKFILATGGSGGHLFPAIELAEELRRRGHSIIFAGSLKQQSHQIEKRGFEQAVLSTQGFNLKNPVKLFQAIGCLVNAFFQAVGIIRKSKPNVVIGFGGHGSFAVVMAASLMNIKTMIHEQNVLPGRANRILSKFVRTIAVSFQPSIKYFHKEKTFLTGCPTHLKAAIRDVSRFQNEWGFTPTRKTILIFGGSQGAQRLNDVFLQAIALLNDASTVQIIHITGMKDFSRIQEAYRQTNVTARVFSFLEEMDVAYQLADLVISRAGAVTITELILFQKKAILIPYPYAGAHQLENAKVVEEMEMAEVIEERNLSANLLIKTIDAMLKDNWYKASNNINRELAENATKRLADLAVRIAT